MNMKKFIAAISAAAMLLGAVSGLTACGGDAHDHIWNDGEITSAPTCTQAGVKTFRCTVEGCTETYTETVDKLAHKFTGEWVEVDDGHAKQCADCEAVDENVIAHTWDEGEVTTQPTFWQDGEKTFTCDDCGKTKTEPVAALTSASHAEEFTTTAENNSWGYGKMEVTGWDGDNFQYNLSPATGTTQDAYIGDGIEIKGGWLSGGGSYISYTVEADITVRIDITAKQVDGGKRMDVRTVLGNEARYHGEYDSGNMSFGEEYTLSAGDTVYIVFTPKGEDTGYEQTDFTVTINKIA